MKRIVLVLRVIAVVVLMAAAVQFQVAVAALACLAPGFCDSYVRCYCTSSTCYQPQYCTDYANASACGSPPTCPLWPCSPCGDIQNTRACQYCAQ